MPPATATPDPATHEERPAAAGRASSGTDRTSNVDRKQLKMAAFLLFGAIIAGIVAFAALSDPGAPTKPTGKATVIPTPNQGVAPKDPGDRGGWEQLALMGILIVTLTGIGVFVVRGRGAKRPARAAWEAAGASERDGAADEVG